MMLKVENLSISYGDTPPVVQGVSFTLKGGRVLAIVGESGSGKTSVIRALIGGLPVGGHITSGRIVLDNRDITALTPFEWATYQGKDISMIFQDSGNALDPIMTVGAQFIDHIRRHRDLNKKDAKAFAVELAKRVSLQPAEELLRRYPFELSGGQRQRLGIAMAMAFAPRLLLADEPTSALDATTQAQIVEELMKLKDNGRTGIIVVTHNIGLAAYMADTLLVMKQGGVVEYGTTRDVLAAPQSAYTKSLLAAVPVLGGCRYGA